MERALGALKDFTRRDILLRFYADRRALTVDEVARASGIHRTVAFDHLERLVALGYLEVDRRRGFPGKPAKIYRLTAGPVQISHPMRRYDVLAEALARSFGEMDADGAQAMKLAGLALGRSLARPRTSSLTEALEPLSDMGGEYETANGDNIVCLNCLFAEVCRRVPDICLFHAGVIEGLTGVGVLDDADGVDGQVVEVEPLGFRDPGCAYIRRVV